MHVTSASAVRRLAASMPVIYVIFDLLYLDGRDLMALPYERAPRAARGAGAAGRRWRDARGATGTASGCWRPRAEQGLEGIVAKRLDRRYEPGRRTGAWLKIKNIAARSS